MVKYRNKGGWLSSLIWFNEPEYHGFSWILITTCPLHEVVGVAKHSKQGQRNSCTASASGFTINMGEKRQYSNFCLSRTHGKTHVSSSVVMDQTNPGLEVWYSYLACLDFGTFKGPKKNPNSTQFIQGFQSRENNYNSWVWRQNTQVLAPAGHLTINPEGYSNRRFWLQNQWQSSWGSAPAQFLRDKRAGAKLGVS